MGRSQRSQNKEKLSRKDKLEMRKESEKMQDQIKTVRFAGELQFNKSLRSCFVDCATNLCCRRLLNLRLCVHEDTRNSHPSGHRRRLNQPQQYINQSINQSVQGPFQVFFSKGHSTLMSINLLIPRKVSCTKNKERKSNAQ